ncbi:hypothetical protein HQ563_15565 [bacterium]|nr:hypothetical protein [bacterium]
MGRNRKLLTPYLSLIFLIPVAPASCEASMKEAQTPRRLVFTQVPQDAVKALSKKGIRFLPPLRNVSGSRIACFDPSKGEAGFRILTPEFVSACSPVVSFDGKRVIFSGKRRPAEPWNVWEMDAEGNNKHRIIELSWDCLMPTYLPSIYTLDNLQPRDQVVFAAAPSGAVNENGSRPAWSFYTCELSGKNLRRITFNLSADFDPTVLPDGRILYSSWQRYGTRYYPTGLVSLLTVMTDGTDLFSFYGNHELPVLKCKPTVSESGWIYFVESDGSDPFGGGSIAGVNLRRNMKSYKAIASDREGLFFSPSPLEGGNLLVSHKRRGRDETYGLYKMLPRTGRITKKLYDAPRWHEIDAQVLLPRPRPKGRSSTVNYNFDTADIFCISCYLTDWPGMGNLAPGSLRRLRVIEGIPLRNLTAKGQDDRGGAPSVPAARKYSATPFGPRRILGDIPLASDGSFYIKAPAGTPIAFQVLDENNMAVQTHQNWMWSMPKENRGCIGCHEDRELTPPNRLAEAFKKPGVNLNLPPEKRRTVDFQHEIAPLIETRCLQCHTRDHLRMDLSEIVKSADRKAPRRLFPRAYEVLLSSPEGGDKGLAGRYIKPGSARESPLVWRLFGKRPDGSAIPKLMPPNGPLSDSERKLFLEWIDLGAQWSNRPSPEDVAKDPIPARATEKEK